jgi:hypothetical protein
VVARELFSLDNDVLTSAAVVDVAVVGFVGLEVEVPVTEAVSGKEVLEVLAVRFPVVSPPPPV